MNMGERTCKHLHVYARFVVEMQNNHTFRRYAAIAVKCAEALQQGDRSLQPLSRRSIQPL